MVVTPVGKHCILELHGCPHDVVNDETIMREVIREASRESRSTLLQLASHRFEPHGVTVLGLLAESHISVHTWPEHGYAAVDIFTCGEATEPERACEFLIDRLGAEQHSIRVLPRGDAPSIPRTDREHRSDHYQESALCPAQT